MKKYIVPMTEVIFVKSEGHLCVDTNEKSDVKRDANWGLSGRFGNDDWINQGYATPEVIEKDNGFLNTQSKGFSAWEDWE